MNIEFKDKYTRAGGNEIEVYRGTESIGRIKKTVWRFAFYEDASSSPTAALMDEDLISLKRLVLEKYH